MTIPYAFVANQEIPLEGVGNTDYALENSESEVAIASDAEVSIIASYATELSIDTLLMRNSSQFPYSMYLIGLEAAWIFSAPFDTIPIDSSCWLAFQHEPQIDCNLTDESLAFIAALFKKTENADSSNHLTSRLVKALKRAGDKEMGGILMGEHISDEIFRVKDLTIQSTGGTSSFFLRTVNDFLKPLQGFFKKKANDFTRSNYLGEWHSHPSFSVSPSSTDCKTMWDIVEDSTIGANFVILIILKLNSRERIEGSVTVYLPRSRMITGELVFE